MSPRPPVFNTFYFQMCFAPQRRALFQYLNFQKWSDPDVFCTFSLRNRLRATTACNFSSLIFPDVSAPAALASLLFNPPEPQNHEKTQCFATFLPFPAPASSFFWSFLFWLFSLLTAFSSLHIVGSLTSKLPSIICWGCLAYLAYMGETFLGHSSYIPLLDGYFQHLFHLCSLFVPFFFFSCFLTDCHFFSFHFFPLVHSALLLMIFSFLLKSNHFARFSEV